MDEEEILNILLSEVELLEAEGESALALGKEQLEIAGRTGKEEIPKSLLREDKAECSNHQPAERAAGVFSLPGGDKRTRWEELRRIVLESPVCRSHTKPGKKVVFGVGNLDADIFFCGEAPGADEEIQGEPFVGRAGQLLTKIISAMGLSRSDVYIGNILNWRPEMPSSHGNRPPTQEEMDLCLPFLRTQVEIVSPKVLVALGATAVNGLFGYDAGRSIGQMRGRWHDFQGIPVMVTYHPSYLLRSPFAGAKRTVWEDMLRVMERLSMPISEEQRKYFCKEYE
ncbi:MAG: uracil-DNA glycosylase [Puniceicoccales bacterium]|nr:uracil-DNA glycosylase [Puniceicoccales bacterium]